MGYRDSSIIFTGLVLLAIILVVSIMGILRFSSPVLPFLSLQSAIGHVGFLVLAHQYSPSQQKDLTHSPHSVSGPRNGGFCKPSREHEKIRTIIDDMKTNLHREKKNRQRLELANSKLVNELADSKLLVKRFMLDYEKERKARELIEVCDELVDGKVMLEEKYS
ncbi:hypothetical protein LguiB_013866 [Lonicera macranthoides]